MFLIDLSAEVNKITFNILKPLYRLLSWTYDFTLNLLTGNIFDGITSLIDSFYTLFAIFMLFRISIVLIQYIIQPDNINDKSMGAGKMVSRILISALLIVSAPYIFKLAHNLQYAIVNPDDGILYSILNVQYSDNIGSNQSLSSVEISGVSNACSVTQGSKFSASTLYSFLSFSGKSDNRYFNALTVILVPGSNCVGISSIESAASSLNSKIYDSNASVDFIVGTIAGIGLIVFLIVFVIDIVVRNLNLLVLESISSIAFICYVNPKDKVFNQWLQNYGKTYVSVFIKFIALSLAVLLIQYINNVLDVTNGFAKLFYIIGLLVFAKALPGFVSKIFGIEGSGSFKESAGILKKGLGFGAGAAAGLVVGGVSRAKAAYQGVRNRNVNNGRGRALGAALVSSVSGAFSGATRGAGAGFSGGGRGVRNAVNSQIANNNRLGNQISQGSTFLGRTRSAILSPFGLDAVGLAEVKKQKLEEQNKSYGSAVELKSKQEEIVKSSVNGQDIQNAAKMGYIKEDDVKRGIKNIYNTDMAEHSARTKIANEMKKDGKSQKDIDDFFDSDEGKEIVKAYERSELAQNLLIKGSSEGKIKTDIKQRFVDEAIAKLSDEAKRGKVVTVEDYANASKMAELDADTYMESETGRNEIEMRKNSGEMSVFSRVYNENLKVKEAVDAGRKKYREELEKSTEYNKLSDDEKQKVISQKEIELQREIVNSTEYKTVFDETIREAQTIRGKNGEIVTKITRDSGDVKKLETNASQFQIQLQNSSDMGDVVVSANIEDAVSDIFTYDNMKTVSNTFTDARNSNDLEITRITTDPKYVKAQVDKAANEENKGK